MRGVTEDHRGGKGAEVLLGEAVDAFQGHVVFAGDQRCIGGGGRVLHADAEDGAERAVVGDARGYCGHEHEVVELVRPVHGDDVAICGGRTARRSQHLRSGLVRTGRRGQGQRAQGSRRRRGIGHPTDEQRCPGSDGEHNSPRRDTNQGSVPTHDVSLFPIQIKIACSSGPLTLVAAVTESTA